MNIYSLYRISTGVKLLSAYSANEILTYLNGENPSDFYVEYDAAKIKADEFVSKFGKGMK